PAAGYKPDNSSKAPSRVSYRLRNHDRVSLKWGAVSGADGYRIYRLSSGDGFTDFDTFDPVAESAKPKYTLKKLTAYTPYTYAVTAFVKSGNTVTESVLCTVSFTTPEKWYYSKGNDELVSDDDPGYDTGNVFRYHYDGSGLKKFNYFKKLPKDSISAEANENTYKVKDVQQYGGYVYLYLTNLDEFADDEGYATEVYRFRSDGTAMERVSVSGGKPDRRLVIDADTSYLGYDSGIDNGELPYITEAIVSKTVRDRNYTLRSIPLFRENGWCISNFVAEGDYLYFFTTPYRVSGRTHVEDYEPDTSAKLWRVYRAAPFALTYDEYGYLKYPDTDGMCECLCGINYPYCQNGIWLIGFRDGYLYYTVNAKTDEDGDDRFVLYRISPTGENDRPEKLVKLDIDELYDAQISGNYIYFFTGKDGYRMKLGGKKLKKLYTLDEGDYYETEYALRENKQPSVVIENGYIYITSYTDEVYYRVQTNGKGLKKSGKPFVWR
ncbi:MAG: fibronectin type III domain-containing protein, partial [Ruminiclostridium sp.]|nr:fibronectin type III domain-containing protein [Ruminiclostridium sp.]